MGDRVGGTTKRTFAIDVGSAARAHSNSETVNGVQWCYDPDRCGEACNSVSARLGKSVSLDNTAWFNAQNTLEKCRAISNAFGMGDDVRLSSFTYACLEDDGGSHTAPGGLSSPLYCPCS